MLYQKKKKTYNKNLNVFQIEPCASLVNTVRSTVPRLLLNRHAVGPFEKVPLRRGDHMELGDLEVTVRRFADLLGWSSEIEELMRTQETLVGFYLKHCTWKKFSFFFSELYV